jgi:hypothetical protein
MVIDPELDTVSEGVDVNVFDEVTDMETEALSDGEDDFVSVEDKVTDRDVAVIDALHVVENVFVTENVDEVEYDGVNVVVWESDELREVDVVK